MWKLTRQVFYLDIYFFVAAIVPLSVIAYMGSSLLIAALLVLSGYIGWSLFEYVLHRWGFHHGGLLEKDHWLHHKEPDEYIGAPNWVSIGSFVVLSLILVVLLNVVIASAILLGFVLGYLTYLGVHHVCHHRIIYPDHMLYSIREHHLRHHHYAGGNYGIMTMIWDRLLGTRL